MSRMDTTSEHNDRRLVGAVAKREILRKYGNASAFARKTGISRKTLDRLFSGITSVGADRLIFIEGELDLPRDTFTFVAIHDMDALAKIGADPDLIRWIREEMDLRDSWGA
jgi:transcriptional regulator with XRE-family HTH domain